VSLCATFENPILASPRTSSSSPSVSPILNSHLVAESDLYNDTVRCELSSSTIAPIDNQRDESIISVHSEEIVRTLDAILTSPQLYNKKCSNPLCLARDNHRAKDCPLVQRRLHRESQLAEQEQGSTDRSIAINGLRRRAGGVSHVNSGGQVSSGNSDSEPSDVENRHAYLSSCVVPEQCIRMYRVVPPSSYQSETIGSFLATACHLDMLPLQEADAELSNPDSDSNAVHVRHVTPIRREREGRTPKTQGVAYAIEDLYADVAGTSRSSSARIDFTRSILEAALITDSELCLTTARAVVTRTLPRTCHNLIRTLPRTCHNLTRT